MVGCRLLMLLVARAGSWASVKGRIERNRLLLGAVFLGFPLPFIAILTGWFTAEVGIGSMHFCMEHRTSHEPVMPPDVDQCGNDFLTDAACRIADRARLPANSMAHVHAVRLDHFCRRLARTGRRTDVARRAVGVRA